MMRTGSEVADTLRVVSVVHEIRDGWHKFTSPEMAGFYLVVAPDDLDAAYEDIPRAIELLLSADSGKRVAARLDIGAQRSSPDPGVQRYTVEFFAA
jgi:hypothetical protein